VDYSKQIMNIQNINHYQRSFEMNNKAKKVIDLLPPFALEGAILEFEGKVEKPDKTIIFQKVWRAPNGHVINQMTDSVGFLVHNVDEDYLVFVDQFRPATVRSDNPNGMITEAPAGSFDKKATSLELMIAEAAEEVGAHAKPNDVVMLNGGIPLALSPGRITERMLIGYIRVISDQIDHEKLLGTNEDPMFGVQNESESIKRVKIPLGPNGLKDFICEDMKTFTLIQWLRAELAEAELEAYKASIYENVSAALLQKMLGNAEMSAEEVEKVSGLVKLFGFEELLQGVEVTSDGFKEGDY